MSPRRRTYVYEYDGLAACDSCGRTVGVDAGGRFMLHSSTGICTCGHDSFHGGYLGCFGDDCGCEEFVIRPGERCENSGLMTLEPHKPGDIHQIDAGLPTLGKRRP